MHCALPAQNLISNSQDQDYKVPPHNPLQRQLCEMKSEILVHTDNEQWNISPHRQWKVKYKSTQTMKSEILNHMQNKKWEREKGTKKYSKEHWD